jgi:RNA recognition motif-containing protein
MSKKLYVGGLSYATTQDELQSIFEDQGNVVSAVVITDRDTGRSKGFGFVEMSTAADATNAIEQLNGANFAGRTITVSEAKERVARTPSQSRW